MKKVAVKLKTTFTYKNEKTKNSIVNIQPFTKDILAVIEKIQNSYSIRLIKTKDLMNQENRLDDVIKHFKYSFKG